VQRIDAITACDIRSQSSKLFNGLGCMTQPYSIRLEDDASPFAVHCSRCIPVPLLPKIKEELYKLLWLGVIVKVEEPTDWCAPIVVVPKKTNDVRKCVDLTKLNEAVRRERHVLPAIGQMLAMIKDAKVFSKLDCNSGFYQVPLTEDCMRLTTFLTPFGRYCNTRLPFGISSAREQFQKRMSDVLDGMEGVLCLIDDIFIYERDQKEHDDKLHKCLQRAMEAHITLNEKCEFSKTEIKLAGHVISSAVIKPDPNKVSAIIKMATPINVSELRCFLGMVNQMFKFCNDLAQLAAPLYVYALLAKDNAWTWEAMQQKCFADVKQSITSAPVLALYDTNKPIIMCAESSSYGLGAILKQQQSDGRWRLVFYASRSLSEVERRYPQVEKKGVALTWSCVRTIC
jgi:hypothetical protein